MDIFPSLAYITCYWLVHVDYVYMYHSCNFTYLIMVRVDDLLLF